MPPLALYCKAHLYPNITTLHGLIKRKLNVKHTPKNNIRPIGRTSAGRMSGGRTRKFNTWKVQAADRSNISAVRRTEG